MLDSLHERALRVSIINLFGHTSVTTSIHDPMAHLYGAKTYLYSVTLDFILILYKIEFF